LDAAARINVAVALQKKRNVVSKHSAIAAADIEQG